MTDTQTPDQSTASPEKRDTNTIGVLVKAFHTLETIAEIGRPMPLRDIAEATGLPKGTLFRVLQTLTTLGYAAQMADTGYYYLTGRLSWLGRDASEEDLKMLTMPLMKELQAQFNETVNLGLLEGTYVYYATVLEADRPLSWRVAPGSRDTYYSTALGRAIAAHLEPAKLDKLIEQTDLKSRTENTVNDKAELVRILNKVKARGLSFDREENDHGVVCIGVPVFLDNQVAGAISLTIPTTRYNPGVAKKLIRALRSLNLHFNSLGQPTVPQSETCVSHGDTLAL